MNTNKEMGCFIGTNRKRKVSLGHTIYIYIYIGRQIIRKDIAALHKRAGCLGSPQLYTYRATSLTRACTSYIFNE